MKDLKARTKRFALDVIEYVDVLPRDLVCSHVGRQLLRSASSVAANYRAACRGRSDAELYSKLCICEEEADESPFWLELLEESGKAGKPVANLMIEANELVSIFVASNKKLEKWAVREEPAAYAPTVSHGNREASEFDLRPSTFDLLEDA